MKQFTYFPKRGVRLIALAMGAVFVLLSVPQFAHIAHAAADDPLPHAPLPAYINNYPKPTVTVDAAEAPDLQPWLDETIVPLLRDWYPVVADVVIGAPRATLPAVGSPNNSYPLVGAFTIKASSTYTGYMKVDPGNVIVFNAAAIRANKPGAPGAFMHEMTHVVHQNKTGPFWFQEGLADYVRAYVYQDYTVPTNSNRTYLNGYMDSAHFIKYIVTQHPAYINDVALYTYRTGTHSYKPGLTTTVTGVSLETHWKNYEGRTITPISNIKPGNATTKCLELPNYATANGTRADIWGCTTGDHHKWVALNKAVSTGGMIQGYYGAKCLRVNTARPTTAGYAVEYWDCDSSASQKFYHRTNSTIYHPATNRCLRPQNSGTANGTLLEVVTCSTATAQKWTFSTAL